LVSLACLLKLAPQRSALETHVKVAKVPPADRAKPIEILIDALGFGTQAYLMVTDGPSPRMPSGAKVAIGSA